MSVKTQNERILFGLKVKQLRQDQGLSFADLSKASHLSVSYLNEIEKGKKYPKEDKLKALADALGTSYDRLVSTELSKSLAPVGELLQSNFLNELPLDLFGIELSKVVEIIASAPVRVGAFISTLLELSRNYALKEENFYFGALRAYLELHNNYFEELEEAVEKFIRQHDISPARPINEARLKQILEESFGYEIVEGGLDAYPELLKLRSVYLPKEKRLLLNSRLTPSQRAFQFGKELGFNFLGIQERANTSSLLRSRVFEEVINHSKAIYFSVALHIPRRPFMEEVEAFFKKDRWDGEAFLNIMKKYDATPEMFYHRLTNILPRFFGMNKLFFLRFIHDPAQDTFEIDKELHLSRRHHPHGNALFEHYCRRWVSLSLLRDLHQMQREGKYVDTFVRAQRSQYIGTEDEYLCLTIARPAYPSPNRNVSVTIGLLMSDELREKIAFYEDPAIQFREVNKTCERCPLTDCAERAAPPAVVNKREEWRRIQERLAELNS
ncbi:MAG: helix-turn-helix domain-containing protein [Lewinellaceae bacterium]|nr:helix-turn-helix domain-containing protein [Lewinellaceae bacterium]